MRYSLTAIISASNKINLILKWLLIAKLSAISFQKLLSKKNSLKPPFWIFLRKWENFAQIKLFYSAMPWWNQMKSTHFTEKGLISTSKNKLKHFYIYYCYWFIFITWIFSVIHDYVKRLFLTNFHTKSVPPINRLKQS